MFSIPFFTLFLVLVAIALRKLSPVRLPIWAIVACGAGVVLITGQLAWKEIIHALDFDVLGYLFGVFVIGQALEESGYLEQLSYVLFRHVKTPQQLMLWIILLGGCFSTILMNDTVAIMATPVVLHIARQNQLPHKPLLLALAYAITIGSVMSPIGNPQNLLIAVKSGLTQPFIQFFEYLTLPTLLSLGIAYGLLWWSYRKIYRGHTIQIKPTRAHNLKLTGITKLALMLMLLLIILKILGAFWSGLPNLKFSWIALVSAAPILLLSQSRIKILKNMDWATLLFFAALFILVQSVWETGSLQALLKSGGGTRWLSLQNTPTILGISVVLSQLISNVPLVALYLPILKAQGGNTLSFLALAVGSTLAGNFLIMGAASNIIIIQQTEKRRRQAFSFLSFAKIGIPLGLLNLLVYVFFFSL